jgi:RNA polymerase sigma-70 factor (ECF subfamily)
MAISEKDLDILLKDEALKRVAIRIAGNREAGEDLYQETILALLTKGNFVKGTNIKAYARTTMRNVFFNSQRRAKFTADVGGDENLLALVEGTAPSETPLDHLEAEQLAAAFNALNADQREAAILVYQQGCGYDEAGKKLGMPPGTVKSRIHRAKARVQKAIYGLT